MPGEVIRGERIYVFVQLHAQLTQDISIAVKEQRNWLLVLVDSNITKSQATIETSHEMQQHLVTR